MSVSKGFLVVGAVYLLVGIGLGGYMGASGDHSLMPIHAHINLLGFVLMTIFGLCYRLIPGLGDGPMPKVHFWLHQVGSLGLMVALTLMMDWQSRRGHNRAGDAAAGSYHPDWRDSLADRPLAQGLIKPRQTNARLHQGSSARQKSDSHRRRLAADARAAQVSEHNTDNGPASPIESGVFLYCCAFEDQVGRSTPICYGIVTFRPAWAVFYRQGLQL